MSEGTVKGTHTKSPGYIYLYFQRQNGISSALAMNLKDRADCCCSEKGVKSNFYQTKRSFWYVTVGFTSANLMCFKAEFLVIGCHSVHLYCHWRKMDRFRGSFFPFILDVYPQLNESGSEGSCPSFH